MPKYEIDVPGKGTYEVDSPTELTDAQAYAAIQSQLNQKPEKESALRQAADIPLNVTKGVVSGVRMLTDVFGANNTISKNLRGVEDYVGDLLSAQAKNDQKEISRIMKEAEDKGVLEQIKAGLNAFTVAPVDLMAQAFGTVIPTLAGGLAGAGLKIGARAAGALTGAAMGAGTGKSSIYDAVTEELSKENLPKELIEQAATKAQEYGGKNLDLILANTLLGGIAGTTGIEKALIPGLSKKISEKVAQRGILGRAVATGLPEAGTEFLQGGTEQASQNIALQREGYNVPTMRGVYSAGTMEGAAGFGMGAATGALKRQTATLEQPVVEPPADQQIAPPIQEPFTPTVIPQAYSTQEGIDRATGVNAESGYTAADLLTPGAEGVREQAQRMATQDLNTVGTPRPRMTEEGRIAAQQAAFDRAAQELGYTDQRQPLPVSPAQSVPYTAPAVIPNEERRKLVDAQSEQLAQAQNEPFEFDRRRLEASASTVGGTGQVRGTPRAVMIDPNPMVPRAARQRLAVLKEDLIAKGEDPASLAIVPHPTMGGRFAIEQRTMEQPYVAPPIETPVVSQAEAQRRIESADAENMNNEYLAQKDLKTLAGKRGEELLANVPSAELAPFVETYQKLRRSIEENIVNRNGVATPEEARMIRDQGLGIPYDSVAEIAADKDVALNTKSKRLLEVEAAFDKEKRKHLKEMYGPEFFEQFGVPEAAPKQASAEFTSKFLNPEGRTAPVAPSTRTAARTSPEQFGQRSNAPQASQYAGKLEVSEDGRYEQLPFQQRTDTPKIEIAKYSLSDATPTPEAKAMADEVRKKLLPVLKRFGLEKMGLRLVDAISNGAEGMYFKNVITLALDSNNPMGVMRHEVIHALKELGAFTNGEWKVLTDMAKKKWINQFYSPELQAQYKAQFDQDGDTNQTFDEYMAEEAIAQAFRFYTETKPPSGLIANLMRRLNNVFTAIREFFMGNGVTDAEQLFLAKSIFSNIESGRMTAGREGVQPRTAPAYAMKTKTGNSATIKQAAKESELTESEFAATSLPLQTGDTGVDAFLNQDIGFKKDVLDYLVQRRMESGVPVLDENKEEDKKLIAKLITAEAMAAIRSGGKALDWYDSVIDKTMSIAALKHPELLENPNKQMAFKIAMAISSQGMNVEANIKFADYVYEQYQKTGRFPEIGQGKDQGQMVSNYKLANNMLDILGESELRKFLETEYTIGELQAAGLDVGGELADEKVLGSSIFGPKIGFGFYSNLSGNFEPVTMDMWFMRLIGRITGKLKAFEPEKFKNQVLRLRDSFKQTGNNGVYASDFDAQDISDAMQSDEGAIALARKVSSMHEKDFKNNREAFNAKNRIKTELVAAAETIIDSVDASIDAPSNGSQRRNLRDIVAMVRENVAKLYGKDIPPASLQALIWYPEQELYKSLGVALRVTSQDYAGAMAKHLKEEGYDAERISGAAKQGSRAAQRMAGISKRLETQESGRKSGKVSTEEKRQGFLNTIRRKTFIGGETPFNKTETKNKFFNQKDIKSETQVITGEVIPSAVGEMQQVTELNYQQKNKLNNQILNSKFIQDMAKSLGIKSILKITSGTGGYANSISPNLIVQMANSNIYQAEKDARDLSYAMSYVFQQDATPYFRADPNLIKKGQLGYSIQFSDKLKEGQEKKLFKILQNLLGNDVGYSKLNGNELILINYRGEDGKPFLTNDKTFKQKLEAFIVEAEKIASISSKEVFGANSEYNYNDWNEKGTGSAIATGIQVRRGDQPNIQEKLNNFRESFVTIARQAVEESGAKPRFSLRPEQLALRPSDSGGAGISFNDRKEDAVSYAGSHYGKTKTNILSGGYYGTGLKGAEAKRLAQAQDPRIGKRIYFYIPRANGTMPMRESGVGNHVYTQKFDNILGPGKTMSEFYKKAQGDSNAFESFVIDNGYDGYAVPDYGMMVVLNNDIEAKYEGTVGEVHYTKLEGKASLRTPPALLKQTTTDAFKRWFGKSAIVDMNGDPKVMYHGTARDITEFRGKQAGAIFVTPKPLFAEEFTDLSENFMIKESFNSMSEEEKVALLYKALQLATKNKKLSKFEKDNLQAYIKYSADSTFNLIPSTIEEEINQLLKDALPSRANIMPVFVRAEKPFDFQNPDHIDRIVTESKKINGNNQYKGGSYVAQIQNSLEAGNWEDIENKLVQDAIKAAGFDAFYIKENGTKNLAVYDPNQLKSAIGNTGAFSRDTGDIRYSLTNNVPPAVHTKLVPNQSAGQQVTAAATNAIKAVREDGFFTNLRNGFVDDTSSLGHTLAAQGMSQFANNKLRADMLRHTQSNSINIMTVGLQSGVPILNSDGSIVIKRTESNMARSIILADKLDSNPYVKASKLKGGRGFVAEVARALRGADIKQEDAAMNAEGQKLIADADALEVRLNAAVKAGGQDVSAIASAKTKIDQMRKEGKELAGKNREKQVDDAQIQWAEAQLQNVPELKEIFGIWKDINNALTDLSEDTGVISKEQAQKYRDKKFYVPLFKAREDLAEAFFRGSSAKNVAKNYKLEGADIDRNIWENLQKQYAMTIAVAYENQTRKVATEQLQGFGLAKTVDNPNDPNINLRYKEDGKIVNVIAENPNDIAAFQMLNYELGPIMKAISATTKVLRFGALVNPMFWIKQLIRDPIHASLTNNQIVTPFNSLVGFVKVLNKSSASAKILAERGVIGAVDSTVDLNEYIGQLGKEKKTPQMISSALHRVMQIHEASDAATRVAIFDSAKKEALKKGMNEEEAINFAVFRARESINFGVRGNSQALNTLRHSIPFFQAAITSLDTVYRAATGYGLPPAEKRKAQIIFAKRAAVMALMSTLYAAMYTDDDEYKDLPDYVKDGNWLFPTTTPDGRKSFVKIPVPFEVGFLFKTIPEAAWRYYTGTSTGKEVGKSYLEGIVHNLPGGGIPIPQAFKPALESITNHSFFTGNPIEGMSDQGKPVVERGRNASDFAKAASEAGLEKVGLSPAKIDALIKGYFAELGGTFLMVTSDLLGSDKPTKNIEAQLGAKAFMTDPKVSKAVSDFYTLEHNAKEMTNMFASLKKEGLFDRAREYLNDEDKKKQLLAAPVFRRIGEQLGKIKTEIRRVENSGEMSADDKQSRINELQRLLSQTAKKGYEVAERAGISR